MRAGLAMGSDDVQLSAGHQEGDPVRIVTSAQLSEGYRRFRGVGDPQGGDRCEYQVIRKLDDGMYLVKEPGVLLNGQGDL